MILMQASINRVLHQGSTEIPNKKLSLPLQVITFQQQDEVFEVKLRLHSGEDVSSTSRNLKITPKPRILLKVEIFGSVASLFTKTIRPPNFSPTLAFKGFLSSKSRLAPFSH
ncbi:hypothetical protein GmHk_15G045051 [Glycine max]|nr:hypothetical protein GmHk_15G045051 [Glycine max]